MCVSSSRLEASMRSSSVICSEMRRAIIAYTERTASISSPPPSDGASAGVLRNPLASNARISTAKRLSRPPSFMNASVPVTKAAISVPSSSQPVVRSVWLSRNMETTLW